MEPEFGSALLKGYMHVHVDIFFGLLKKKKIKNQFVKILGDESSSRKVKLGPVVEVS